MDLINNKWKLLTDDKNELLGGQSEIYKKDNILKKKYVETKKINILMKLIY